MRTVQKVTALLALGLAAAVAGAHCDTLNGPVVADARTALEKGDVAPALKWVGQQQEPAVREAFAKTLKVRTGGPEARELADTYFFETLVRLHRAGEGEPFTGLKPADTDPGPAVTAADKALATGKADDLVKMLTDQVAAQLRTRFATALEAKKHANESPEAGRKFVAAYVALVHYAESLATPPATHPHDAPAAPASPHLHAQPAPAAHNGQHPATMPAAPHHEH